MKFLSEKKWMKVIAAAVSMAVVLGSGLVAFAESADEVIGSGSDIIDVSNVNTTDSSTTDSSFENMINQKEVVVYLNDEQLEFEAAPEIINGSTFVPMRVIFEALGADVQWSDKRREAVATIGFDEVVLKVGSTVAIHNTDVSMIGAAPYIKDGNTMVPLRFLSESLNYDVSWDPEERRVDIIKDEAGIQESSTGEGDAFTVLGDLAGITYDDAMQRSIQNSQACQSAHLSLRQAERRSDEFNNLYSMNYNFTIMQNRKDLKLLTDWSEKNVVVTEEQTAFGAVSSMNEISMKLLEIENQRDVIAYAKQKHELDRIKLDAGAVSRNDFDASFNAIKSAQKTLQALETELEGMYIGLYSMMGKDYSNHSVKEGDPKKLPEVELFLEPEFAADYVPVGEVNLLQAYNTAVTNDPYIWYVENNAENADFKLITYEYNVGGKSYALTQMDLQSAQITADSTKDSLRETIYSRYNQLVQLENNIDILYDNLETLRNNIDLMRTFYEQGLQSKAALEEVLQNKRMIDYNLANLKLSHSQLKMIFEKPYLAPEYMAQ